MSWVSSVFLHPGLVWFLPLAAIPIILHLLMLHRLKTVELSTFRFLFDSYVQQRRRMRFLEALLAMLRTLFLLLLVLVFCRPVVKHWSELFPSGSGNEIVMLVDCSASMNARTAGMSAFERAKRAAESIVERLTPQDRLTVIRVTAKPDEVLSQFAVDRELIRNKIEELKTGPSRANLFAALTHLFGPEAERRPDRMVYVFTDCQASGWREVRNQGLERAIPPETQLKVVNVGSNQPMPNLAVVGDARQWQRAVVGLPVFLQTRVAYHAKASSGGAPQEVTLKVFIDEKEVTRQQVTLKPGETAVRRIQYYPTEPGIHRGRFEIAGRAPDAFPDDDHFLFTLQVVPQLKVVLVNGNPAADPVESECFFLSSALSSRREPTPAEKQAEEKRLAAMGLAKDFYRALDVQEVSERTLNAETVRDASVVILANCGGLGPQQFAWLRDFVAAGGGLLIFPGERVNPDIYNTQFLSVAGSQQEPLTPVRLGRPDGDLDKADMFERLAAVDFTHPILSVFDVANTKFFDAVFFQRRFPLVIPEKQRDKVWTLASFTKGTPALVESRFGDGIVLLAAFPADKKWTNLPARGGHAFVPLILRSVSYAQHRPDVEAPLVVPPNGVAEIAVNKVWGQPNGKVTDPAGRVSTLAFERAGSRQVAAFEGTAEKGYYNIEVQSGQAQQTKNVGVFAVNVAPEESDFATLGEEQLRELLPNTQLTVVDASAEAQQEHNLNDDGKEIWRWLIWILFPLIVVEFLLATLSGRRGAAEETPSVAERIREFTPGSWVGRMTGESPRRWSIDNRLTIQ
jgi:hypothetical protein